MPDVSLSVEIVINACPGGFALSDAARRTLADLKGIRLIDRDPYPVAAGTDDRLEDVVPRDDRDLIEIVRTMGSAANGPGADLRVVRVNFVAEVVSRFGTEDVEISGTVER